MQAPALYLSNALSNVARGGKIPVALAMFWLMFKLDFSGGFERCAHLINQVSTPFKEFRFGEARGCSDYENNGFP